MSWRPRCRVQRTRLRSRGGGRKPRNGGCLRGVYLSVSLYGHVNQTSSVSTPSARSIGRYRARGRGLATRDEIRWLSLSLGHRGRTREGVYPLWARLVGQVRTGGHRGSEVGGPLGAN